MLRAFDSDSDASSDEQSYEGPDELESCMGRDDTKPLIRAVKRKRLSAQTNPLKLDHRGGPCAIRGSLF